MFLALAALAPATVGTADAKTYYDRLLELFRSLPNSPEDVYFVGDSLTAAHPFDQTLPNAHARNRGIAGDTAWNLPTRLDEIVDGRPAKIFLMIGANDLLRHIPREDLAAAHRNIVAFLRERTPATRLYLQSLLPVNPEIVADYFGDSFGGRTPPSRDDLAWVNARLRELAKATENTEFIDLAPHFADPRGYLREDLTYDGLHLRAAGTVMWADLIRPYAND